jgi:uncharacterized protein (DUF4415 family)/uncharacterized DUF497 family protein
VRYTWDPDKNVANVHRHGIAFQDAARILDGPTVERVDDRFEYGEVQIYAIGLLNGVEVTVIYTDAIPANGTSYRPGGQTPMSDDTSGKNSATEPATDRKRLRNMTDEEIRAAITDDPDIVPTDEAFWAEAHVVRPRQTESVTINLDTDVLEWFRVKRGFQARINSMLRAYVDAQRGPVPTTPAPDPYGDEIDELKRQLEEVRRRIDRLSEGKGERVGALNDG